MGDRISYQCWRKKLLEVMGWEKKKNRYQKDWRWLGRRERDKTLCVIPFAREGRQEGVCEAKYGEELEGTLKEV